MRVLVILLCGVWLAACAHLPPGIGIDPTLNWTEVTTGCDGNPLSGVTYNVYAIPGPGPIPTVSSGADELPCGVVQIADRAAVVPRNAAPLTATTYQLVLADGVYTAAIEAVNTTGNVSALSSQKTFTVVGRPGVPQTFTVGP